MADDSDTKSVLQLFAERWFAPAALIISGIAGGVSYWAQYQSRKAQIAAEEASRAANFAKEQSAQAALQRDYAFRVSGLVLTSINDADQRKQKTLLALVDTVDEPFRTKLVRALSQAGEQSVQQDAKAILAFDQQSRADSRKPAQPTPVAQQRTVAVAAGVAPGNEQLAGYKLSGWDIDIFWCQGDAGETVRHARAQTFGKALADLSKSNQKLEGAILGRIRVRPLSAVVNSRPGYGITSDVLRPDSAETAFAGSLTRLAGNVGTPLGTSLSASATKWYMSAFFCG
jgi:hypothetical protein